MTHAQEQIDLIGALNAAYAAGALEGPLALLAETRAAMDGASAADLIVAEAIAGGVFEAEAAAALSPSALERVLALAMEGAQERATDALLDRDFTGAFAEELALLPRPARAAASTALRAQRWGGGLGVRSLPLLDVDGCKAELLRLEPGGGAPRHTHTGAEFTLVLTGAFHDGLARYGVGDIAIAGPGITHRPVAEPGAVCYALAVTDAPLRFTGALGVLQRIWPH